jgi:hypothetical protein
MITVTAPVEIAGILGEAKELVEIRDSSGKVIGFFAPSSMQHAAQYAKAAAQTDRAVIQRAKEESGPNRTTAEVLERLRALENG